MGTAGVEILEFSSGKEESLIIGTAGVQIWELSIEMVETLIMGAAGVLPGNTVQK